MTRYRRQTAVPPHPRSGRRVLRGPRRSGLAAALVVLLAVVVLGGLWVVHRDRPPGSSTSIGALPTTPGSYLGVYVDGVPASYAGVTSFAAATEVRPNVVSYYSGWLEQFRRGFAEAAGRHGAVPLVQIDPTNISMTAIASGHYDSYLTAYARAVRGYHRPVIIGFGHEMNAYWYTWGHRHATPAEFVAAWRHIVKVFRAAGARNVTWMWTVNAIDMPGGIPSPKPWWPGRAYVTWVGIDGYYLSPSAEFASVFGPTVAAVRELTGAPILVAETGASPSVGQPGKITSLFAGTRTYGLLGFIWFDVVASGDYRLRAPDAIAAYRRGATTYREARPPDQPTPRR
ncbi:MAG TPA: glycosyl hydrolase [Streptosporangiaceae bacterium]